ncbi:MAG: hypothetical protein E7575_06350 [Ruminococcaceae bacterium]|nr:hypothetical protein [Oscillospiraceae bacterium]
MKRILSLVVILSLVLSCAVLATSCKEKDKKAIATAYVLAEKGNTYSIGLANSFKIAFEDKGGKVVMETYPTGTTGFSDYLKKAKEVGADVIFTPNSAIMADDFLKNAVDLEINVPILAGDTWESPNVLEAVKDTQLNVYCSTFFNETESSDIAKQFTEGFKQFVNYNSEYYEMNGQSDIVTAVAALGYDAYNIALSAIRSAAEEKGAKLTSIDIANALWKTEHNGVTGKISFDENGDAIKNSAYIIKALNDGSAFDFVKVQSVSQKSKMGTAPEYEGEGITIDTENKKIIIGVFEPITGDFSIGGKQEIVGIRYANSLDNTVIIDGEEYSVELYVMDNGSLPENAVAIATKIIEGGAVITLGTYGSDIAIAAAPVFDEALMPVIGPSCTNPAVTEDNDFYFRTCFLDPFQGEVMADFALSLVTDSENSED